jgi:PGF-pre-PGF domain-containing protein
MTAQTVGEGDPIENATVTAYENGTRVANATTGADGEYVVAGLAPGDYRVVADADSFVDEEWSGRVDPNVTRTADFQLDYAGNGTIAGTVELDVVDPGENVTVTVVADDVEKSYGTDLALEGETSTAEYALEDVAVNVDSGYEVVATTDAAYANASVSGVEVWVNETARVNATVTREPGSLNGSYEVNVTGTNAPVEVDETQTVEVNVTNVGERGYRNVSLAVEADDGSVVGGDRAVPLLEAGENATVALEWPASVDAGEYTARVSTPDDEDNATITIEPASTSDGGGGSGGGGGGGGMAPSDDGDDGDDWPEPIRQATQAISDAEQDASGTTVRFSGMNLEEIVFSNEGATGAISQRVSVEEVDDLPGNAPALPNQARAVSVSRVTVPEEHRNAPATLRTRVSSERLEELDAAPEELTVYRLPDGADEWQSLEPTVTETDDGVVVEFQTPGFSAFAVARQEQPEEPTPTPTPTPTDAAETPTPTPTDAAKTPTLTPTDASDGPDVGLIGLLVVVVLAIAGGAAYYSTLREPDE